MESFLPMVLGLVLLWNGITGTQSPIYRLVAGTASYLTRHYQLITSILGFGFSVGFGYLLFSGV